MKNLIALSALLVVACAAFAADGGPVRPRYVVLPPHGGNNNSAPAASLQEWTGTLLSGTTFHMVGTDPSTTNTTTTINVYVIPVNICVTVSGKKTCFDPKTKQSNGASAITNVANSPIFQNLDYVQTGTDIGNTQYEDAFQRSNFWSDVMTNTNYHVLLKPILLPEVTLNVPTAYGTISTDFGVTAANVDINYLDGQIGIGLPKLKQITPASLALIMTYDTYLTEGGCCIGGYHSANGAQTYSEFTYAAPGSGGIIPFSADVSALSHELGEWLDDPLTPTQNNSPCGPLEVGDPLENEKGTLHNYGDYTYTLNGFTYHLQDLATMHYFGQSPDTVNGGNWTFQGQTGQLPGYSQPIGECTYGS